MNIIEKLKVLFLSFRLTCKYVFLTIFSHEKLSCNHNGNHSFAVSLTSYGARVNFVFLTIESILQQKTKPTTVLLWLYKEDKPNLWAGFFLNRQVRRGLRIIYLEDDYRSYKKLSYVLNYKIESQYYVTADDDVFYPINWLSGFNTELSNNPHAVYCYRGRTIQFANNDEIVPYNNWKLASKKDIEGRNLLPTGVSGVCYPMKSLDDRISDFDAVSDLCPYADDVWYKMVTTANGYRSLLINENSEHFTPIITGFIKGLEKYNVYQDRNTPQFNNSLKYFNLSKQDFE
ncbi:hypothetical protein EJE24_00305 [Enterobacter huaxiensis]|uniref:Glycosyltransferase family 2 protein n=1 Tax=Enterobacter huaxiensis TaxID=2494702 RepID=A0A3R9NHA3_9ENTR|nr:hypothetical protein [Enterobacter huaxiensis]RSK70255.1 hypothetical protein EJE24_00305 [Enterobacter huaxiensis]